MIRWRQQGYHDDLSFHPVSRMCKVDKCAWSSSAQNCFWFLIFSRCGTIIYDLGNTNNLVSMVTQTTSFCFRRCFIPWCSFSSHKPHTKAKGRGENTKNRDRKKRKGKKILRNTETRQKVDRNIRWGGDPQCNAWYIAWFFFRRVWHRSTDQCV